MTVADDHGIGRTRRIRWLLLASAGALLAIGLYLNPWLLSYLPAVAGWLFCCVLIVAFPLYVIGNIAWIFKRIARRRRCREEWARGDEAVTLRLAFRDGLRFSGEVGRKRSLALSSEATGEAIITLTVSTRGGTRKVVSGSIALVAGMFAKASFPELDHEGVLILSSGTAYEPQEVEKELEARAKDCGCQPLTIARAGWVAWESGTHDGLTDDGCRLTVAGDGRRLDFASS